MTDKPLDEKTPDGVVLILFDSDGVVLASACCFISSTCLPTFSGETLQTAQTHQARIDLAADFIDKHAGLIVAPLIQDLEKLPLMEKHYEQAGSWIQTINISHGAQPLSRKPDKEGGCNE